MSNAENPPGSPDETSRPPATVPPRQFAASRSSKGCLGRAITWGCVILAFIWASSPESVGEFWFG